MLSGWVTIGLLTLTLAYGAYLKYVPGKMTKKSINIHAAIGGVTFVAMVVHMIIMF